MMNNKQHNADVAKYKEALSRFESYLKPPYKKIEEATYKKDINIVVKYLKSLNPIDEEKYDSLYCNTYIYYNNYYRKSRKTIEDEENETYGEEKKNKNKQETEKAYETDPIRELLEPKKFRSIFDNYDPNHKQNATFTTYFENIIENEIKRAKAGEKHTITHKDGKKETYYTQNQSLDDLEDYEDKTYNFESPTYYAEDMDLMECFVIASKKIKQNTKRKLFPLVITERIVYLLQEQKQMRQYAKNESKKVKDVIDDEFAKHYLKEYSEDMSALKIAKLELKLSKEFGVTDENKNKPCGYYDYNLYIEVFTSYSYCKSNRKGTVSDNRGDFIKKISEELTDYGIKLSPKTNEKAKQPIIKSMLHEMSMAENSIPEEITITEDDVESARLSLLRKLIDIELDPDGRMEEYMKEKALSYMFS